MQIDGLEHGAELVIAVGTGAEHPKIQVHLRMCSSCDDGEGSGFRIQGSGFKVQGSGFDSRFKVQGSRFKVQGFKVQESEVPDVLMRAAEPAPVPDHYPVTASDVVRPG